MDGRNKFHFTWLVSAFLLGDGLALGNVPLILHQLKPNNILKQTIHKIVHYSIATVWILNGLFCKVINLVPRHQQIVARILGPHYATLFTKAIGMLELFMAIWILSKIKSRFCALTQMVVIAIMNIMEFYLAPDLLLFGKLNSLVALVFISIIYFNEFVLNKPLTERV